MIEKSTGMITEEIADLCTDIEVMSDVTANEMAAFIEKRIEQYVNSM